MSAGNIGLQKLNMPKTASPKAAIAANLGNASRSTGVSYGIFAQRSLTGSGIHLNNRLFNSASISATRHALNDNRVALFNNIGVAPHKCNHNNGDNTMNKFMAGMMAMNMMAKLTAQTIDTINSAKSNKADKSSPVDSKNNNNASIQGKSLNDRLDAAKSFSDIKNIELELNNKLSGFGAEYSKIGKSADGSQTLIQETLQNEDIQAGLKSAGVTIDYSKLTLSGISLTETSSISDIETAVGQIDTDKKAVEEFQNTQVKTAVASCQTKIEALDASIRGKDTQITSLEAKKTGDASVDAGIDAQIAEIKQDIEKLKAEKAEVEKAKEALETTVKQQVSDITKALDTKKSELNDLKKTKAEMMDKKYDLAKEQDEKATKNQTKMDKLKKEIDTLRSQTTDPKKGDSNLDKLNKKIGEYNGLATEMKTLYKSLKDAGVSEITNSKNQKHTIKNANENASYTAPITPIPIRGAGTDLNLSGNIQENNTAITNNIKNCQVGQAIDIGNNTYVKGADGNFTSDLGQVFTEFELMEIHMQNENNPLNKKLGLS